MTVDRDVVNQMFAYVRHLQVLPEQERPDFAYHELNYVMDWIGHNPYDLMEERVT